MLVDDMEKSYWGSWAAVLAGLAACSGIFLAILVGNYQNITASGKLVIGKKYFTQRIIVGEELQRILVDMRIQIACMSVLTAALLIASGWTGILAWIDYKRRYEVELD